MFNFFLLIRKKTLKSLIPWVWSACVWVYKTELIFFHSNRHKLDYDNIYINFNGLRLNPVDFIKYLGMYIDKYLNWNDHIHEISKKLSRANGIRSKLRYNASLDTCLHVYYAIFFSHLTYGCNIWGFTS